MDSPTHVALISSPGMGHLFPSLELATRLSTRHHLTLTVFLVTSHSSSAENNVVAAAEATGLFTVVELPPADMSDVTDSTVVGRLAITMRRHVPALRSAISALTSRPSALIADIFSTEAFAVADEFHMAKYVFVASNAWFLALTIYAQVLDKQIVGQYVDQKEPLQIPGCEPVRPCDVVDPMLDRTESQYYEYVKMGRAIASSHGVLVNSWDELQGRTLASFKDRSLLGRVMNAPVYSIGPIVRHFGSGKDGSSELFNWLRKQPGKSVIYVSFGSGGTLSFEQMTEMAHGLELSRQRFVWVVRPPTVRSDAMFFTTGDGSEDQSEARYLPEGFLERTSEVGFLVSMWAEQTAVLGSPAVGGFFTHGGWNSSLEGITKGVPMIVWPLYAEQRMNATMLADEMGVAVRPKELPGNAVIGREEIAAMVRKIMAEEDEEGRAIRAKAMELQRSAEKACAQGGSSYENFARVVKLFGRTG
ncbi:anthocyanidin 3-O-glucosyltransferase 5-like isoform X1 [Cucurbita moschata]|uniref:Glycosyltransferase n=2 Tax=Cucurbita moschata TaxID=3662 RepID=A0A6J1FTD7_CUCMO|nr:anthocyanidin 3-O-glucosyltransferase 5-like isoform X1 [Cucurbita moschata]